MFVQKKIAKNSLQLDKNTYKNISGFFYELDEKLFDILLNFQNTNNIDGNILEIGVFYGRSFIYLTNYIKDDEIIYGIDVGHLYYTTQSTYNIHYEYIKYINDYSYNINNYNIENLRFAHIDGSHHGIDVYNDIKNVYNKLADDGIIVLDDFSKEQYLQIISAFFKASNELTLIPICCSDMKIYIVKNLESYFKYYNYLVEHIKSIPAKNYIISDSFINTNEKYISINNNKDFICDNTVTEKI